MHTFCQVMTPRIATFCVMLAVFMYSTQIELLFHICSPVSDVKLNFISIPVFQTINDPGLAIPPVPERSNDIPRFILALVQWASDTFISYSDKKKFHLRSIVVLGVRTTLKGVVLSCIHAECKQRQELCSAGSFRNVQNKPC